MRRRGIWTALALLLGVTVAEAQPLITSGTNTSVPARQVVLKPVSRSMLSLYVPVLAQVGRPFAGGGGASYPVSDEVFKVCDNGDSTKCAELELTGVTTANTIPITLTGTAAAPGFAVGTSSPWGITVGANTTYTLASGAHVFKTAAGNSSVLTNNGGLTLSAGSTGMCFASGDAGATSADTCWDRAAANVFKPASGDWLQQTPGRISLASDFTDTDATVTDTALSITVISGRKYSFNMVLFFSNSTAADGIRVDFNGGTATSTNFRVHCLVHDTALLLSQQSTALDTDIVATTTTGASQMDCNGTFEPSGAGTFIVRAAEEADGGGTLTVTRGSWLNFEDQP